MRNTLEEKFRKHMLDLVGEIPTKNEMYYINKITKVEYKKIYDKPNKPTSITMHSYNKVLSKIWPKVVASTASFSEIVLLSNYVKFKPYYNITSLASGLCVFELFLAKEFVSDGQIHCIDLSVEMNKQARALARKLKQHNIKIITASAAKPPIASNSQDVVLIRRSGLSNDKKWINVLKESYRILKKAYTSRFVYTVAEDFNKPTKIIKKDLLAANLEFIAIRKFGTKENAPSFMIIARPKKVTSVS
ncbi:class I SAM-dependent methyltransferase [Candidatus Parvarchaeota archaeon]|nr:class I SAM-dependent methyltransferase [Candidatus Acidifodinimicrobium mancum]